MIHDLGPQRRLVDFFAAICIVEGRAVKANQEMVLRLTWMRPEVRHQTFLQLRPLSRSASSRDYGAVTLPSGATSTGMVDPRSPRPADFLEKDVYDAGFYPLGITWSGSAVWSTHLEDSLFWDADFPDGEK